MAMIIPMEITIFRCPTYVDGAQISPTRDLAVTKDSFFEIPWAYFNLTVSKANHILGLIHITFHCSEPDIYT